jgi:hypothetical protein
MPPPSTGLVEMGGCRTTLNNGVFDEAGQVLTFWCLPQRRMAPPLPPPPCARARANRCRRLDWDFRMLPLPWPSQSSI